MPLSTSSRKRKTRSAVPETSRRSVRPRTSQTPAYSDDDRKDSLFSDDATPAPENPRPEHSQTAGYLQTIYVKGSHEDAHIDAELARQYDMANMAPCGISPVMFTGRNLEEWREGILFEANLFDAVWFLLDNETMAHPDDSELDRRVWEFKNEVLFVRILRSLDPSVRRDQGCFLMNTRSSLRSCATTEDTSSSRSPKQP